MGDRKSRVAGCRTGWMCACAVGIIAVQSTFLAIEIHSRQMYLKVKRATADLEACGIRVIIVCSDRSGFNTDVIVTPFAAKNKGALRTIPQLGMVRKLIFQDCDIDQETIDVLIEAYRESGSFFPSMIGLDKCRISDSDLTRLSIAWRRCQVVGNSKQQQVINAARVDR